jgi:hypothetical protein
LVFCFWFYISGLLLLVSCFWYLAFKYKLFMNNVSDEKNRGITHLSKVSLCIPFVYLLNLAGEVPTFGGFHLHFLVLLLSTSSINVGILLNYSFW